MRGEVFHAAISNPRRIVDIGCGTGRTTVQLAAKYPDAQVIGVDLSAVPSLYEHPRNVAYIQGEFNKLVTSGDERLSPGSIDYVLSRCLILGVTGWPGYFANIGGLLAPGGYVESHEVDITLRDANDNRVVGDREAEEAFHYLAARKGMDLATGSHLVSYLEEANLEIAGQQVYRWPILPMPDAPETDVCS